jgi:hypothetical protein
MYWTNLLRLEERNGEMPVPTTEIDAGAQKIYTSKAEN